MLETNIDNMNGEIYSYIFPKLLGAGALDVFVTPIIMKKNRPANKLSVLIDEDKSESIEKIIFMETTTIGIRKYRVEREELKREFINLDSRFGVIRVKASYLDGEIIKCYPEYEDCARIGEERSIPIQDVYTQINADIENKIKNRRF